MNDCKHRFWTFETLPDFAMCYICGAWKNKNGVVTENKGEIGIAKVVTNSKCKKDAEIMKNRLVLPIIVKALKEIDRLKPSCIAGIDAAWADLTMACSEGIGKAYDAAKGEGLSVKGVKIKNERSAQ